MRRSPVGIPVPPFHEQFVRNLLIRQHDLSRAHDTELRDGAMFPRPPVKEVNDAAAVGGR